jgi:hypothetical protein
MILSLKTKKVIDNITIVKPFSPPLCTKDSKPFDHIGLMYQPVYKNGVVARFESNLRNLRILIYPEKICLVNSWHKFSKGNNWSDFNAAEILETIEQINGITGIDWRDAQIKKIEYGCNIEQHTNDFFKSLQSYKSKNYLPMSYKGSVYGAKCEFQDYAIKCYNKTFEALKTDGIAIDKQITRWEIVTSSMKHLHNRRPQLSLIKVKDLGNPNILHQLANDAIQKFRETMKIEQVDLSQLTTSEKKVLAVMRDPELKEDFRRNQKETYKKDLRIFKKIMSKHIIDTSKTGEKLEAKFDELLNI